MRAGELLVVVGQALYGERWQTPLARDLGTTYRTIRNWQTGVHSFPKDLRNRLVALLRARGSDIDAVLERIGEGREEIGRA